MRRPEGAAPKSEGKQTTTAVKSVRTAGLEEGGLGQVAVAVGKRDDVILLSFTLPAEWQKGARKIGVAFRSLKGGGVSKALTSIGDFEDLTEGASKKGVEGWSIEFPFTIGGVTEKVTVNGQNMYIDQVAMAEIEEFLPYAVLKPKADPSTRFCERNFPYIEDSTVKEILEQFC